MMVAVAMLFRFFGFLREGTTGLPSGESIFWYPPVAGYLATVGITWFFAARSLWGGRWWRGVAAFVLGLAAHLGLTLLSNWLGIQRILH